MNGTGDVGMIVWGGRKLNLSNSLIITICFELEQVRTESVGGSNASI